jgi:Cu(I)/Ag(I) efflux system membrane fusion protein
MTANKANPSKSFVMLVIGVVLGTAATMAGYTYLAEPNAKQGAASGDEKKPLYWVAPMDPNYRRDKPGKSPMGMDLIPVYEAANDGADAGPGTIKISPDVVNNLGVRTAEVEQKSLHAQIQTVGYVAYDEDRLVHVHPRVEGWIEKLHVKAAGDPVQKDQPLYDIYSPALVNAQEELVLALDRKNKRLIRAAKARLKALQLPAQAIKAVESSRKVQQFITAYAPQEGVVDNLNIREGFYVKPGTTLMSIGTLEQVWVEAEVFERQAFIVAVGQPVTMRLDYLPGKQWQGTVDYIYPTLNSKTRTVKVRLRFANENAALKPNMFAQIAIHAQDGESALLVPKEAVIRSGNADRVVLALGEGRFKSIAVELGRSDESAFEVLSGLSEGERVVTSAQFLLDSESSKTSDFKRMAHGEENPQPSTVWTEATINSLMAGHRMVNVTHDAIDEWDWPAMTMDFTVAEQVDFAQFTTATTVQIEIEKTDDDNYHIINVEKPDNSATVDGVINNIMAGHRMLNISRGAIEKWGRGPATMDFMVADNVALDTLSEGMSIRFTFEIKDGELVITELTEKAQSSNAGGQDD